jgi:hypothetical protein
MATIISMISMRFTMMMAGPARPVMTAFCLPMASRAANGLYYDPEMIGGALITIHSDGSFVPAQDYSTGFLHL